MKSIKIISTFIISLLFIWIANSASLDSIVPLDKDTLEITISQNVVLNNWDVSGDVKVVKDFQIYESYRDTNDKEKITIKFTEDLYKNASYSLISVWLAEGSIEFVILDNYNSETTNPSVSSQTKNIKKLNVIDERTIEVFYNYPVDEGIYDFKLLSELLTEKVYSDWDNKLYIDLIDSMEALSSYILMLSYLDDVNWKEIIFDEILYDFITPTTLVEVTPDLNASTEEEQVEEEISPSIENEEDEWNLEDVAINTTKQPETGPATWFMLLVIALMLATSLAVFRKQNL